MGSRHWVRRLAIVVGSLLCVAFFDVGPVFAFPQDVGAQVGVGQQPAAPPHDPPVEAPVVDPFRAPPEPWLPGNRGIEYGPTAGEVVRASAPGVVTFAGTVAGTLFVTVAHDAELRTTVGFLESADVVAGDVVTQGQPLGTAGASLHFSARRNGAYIDPALLFGRYEIRVRLVP